MMPVSCCSTPEHRRLLLADILAKHLNDDSKWVRISAFQILGPFISTFAKQFTEVTYNKNGELVYTSKQDIPRYSSVFFYYHCNLCSYQFKWNVYLCSICYSYEEIFPTKGAMKSQIPNMDDNTKTSFYLSVMDVEHDNVKVSDSSEDYQMTKDKPKTCSIVKKRRGGFLERGRESRERTGEDVSRGELGVT